jgi:hypothetical protein
VFELEEKEAEKRRDIEELRRRLLKEIEEVKKEIEELRRS